MSQSRNGVRVRPRLLFLNNQGLTSVGGGVTILRKLVTDLVRDFDVTVLSYDPPAPNVENLRQIRVAPSNSKSWRFAPIIRASFLVDAVPKAEIDAADLVVALDCHFLLSLRRARPRRLIYLSLSCIPRQEWFAANGIAAGLFFAQYAYLERGMVEAAAVVLVSSARHASELRRFECLPGLKPFVLHPVFHAARFQPRRVPTQTTTLVGSGRLTPVKNYQSIVALAARLSDLDCKFIIAGDGPEQQRLNAMVAAAGVSDRVKFIGPISEIGPLLDSADLFLHPSRYESFGIAVFEAMRAGVPPVCSSTSVLGIGEFLKQGVDSILVDFDRPDHAASVLRELVADPTRRAKIGSAARSSAERMAARDYVTEFRAIISTLGIVAP